MLCFPRGWTAGDVARYENSSKVATHLQVILPGQNAIST
jgi:hypothetical protein